MPGFDGTGPWGMGPMTGGGRGLCGPRRDVRPVPAGRWLGPGRGWGIGRGAGWRWFRPGIGRGPVYGGASAYTRAMSGEEELGFLKGEAEAMKRELDEIEARIRSIENQEQ
jgi:hypothetical protein